MALSSKHILGMEHLSRQDIFKILSLAKQFKKQKKLPSTLKGKIVFNLFFEPSTRTQTSFEIAAKKLGATTIHINTAQSSTVKGETLSDTARTIEAMNPDVIVIRHPSSGAPYLLSKILKTPVINAGDGFHEHPTQALLDMLTIEETKGRLADLRVLIVGDIAHSRIARSDIYGLTKMGAKTLVCGPPTLIPPFIEKLGVKVFYHLKEAVKETDVIIMLRIQKERHNQLQFPSYREYIKKYCLNLETLKYAKSNVMIMHPGPLNRGVEIAPEIADGPYSVILNQVSNGIVIRMALLHLMTNGEHLGTAH